MHWRGLRELSKISSSANISYNPLLADTKLNVKRFWLFRPHDSKMNVGFGAPLSDA